MGTKTNKTASFSKQQQIDAFNRYWEMAKMQCLDAIELGMPWEVNHQIKDKNPDYDCVITIKYKTPYHWMKP